MPLVFTHSFYYSNLAWHFVSGSSTEKQEHSSGVGWLGWRTQKNIAKIVSQWPDLGDRCSFHIPMTWHSLQWTDLSPFCCYSPLETRRWQMDGFGALVWDNRQVCCELPADNPTPCDGFLFGNEGWGIAPIRRTLSCIRLSWWSTWTFGVLGGLAVAHLRKQVKQRFYNDQPLCKTIRGVKFEVVLVLWFSCFQRGTREGYNI